MVNVTNVISSVTCKTKDGKDMLMEGFPLTEVFKELLLAVGSGSISESENSLDQKAVSDETLDMQNACDRINIENLIVPGNIFMTAKTFCSKCHDEDELKMSEMAPKTEKTAVTDEKEVKVWGQTPKVIPETEEKTEKIEIKAVQEAPVTSYEIVGIPTYEIIAGAVLEVVSTVNHDIVSQKNNDTATQKLGSDPIKADSFKAVVLGDSLEVLLEPENLGRIVIKASHDRDGSNISIACENRKTMEILAQNVREIGGIIEQNLGSPATIFVEKGDENYLSRENSQQGHQGHQERNNEQKDENPANRKMLDEDSLDFLQQLRLGLKPSAEAQHQ